MMMRICIDCKTILVFMLAMHPLRDASPLFYFLLLSVAIINFMILFAESTFFMNNSVCEARLISLQSQYLISDKFANFVKLQNAMRSLFVSNIRDKIYELTYSTCSHSKSAHTCMVAECFIHPNESIILVIRNNDK